MGKKSDVVIILLNLTIVAAAFHNYFTNPSAYKRDLLEGTAKYVEQFEGPVPSQALAYAKTNIAFIKKQDKIEAAKIKAEYPDSKRKVPNYEGLEDSIARVEAVVGDCEDSKIYQPVLGNLAGEIDDMAGKYDKPVDLYVGIFSGLLAGIIASCLALKKKYMAKRNQLIEAGEAEGTLGNAVEKEASKKPELVPTT